MKIVKYIVTDMWKIRKEFDNDKEGAIAYYKEKIPEVGTVRGEPILWITEKTFEWITDNSNTGWIKRRVTDEEIWGE